MGGNQREEQNLNEILKLRRKKLKALKENKSDPFVIEKYDRTHTCQIIKDKYEEYKGTGVSIAGRIMTMRGHGKASFADVQDRYGRIQIYVREDEIGRDKYDEFTSYDIGDIVGVKGEVFKTRKGEISVKASEIVLLSKSLQILPEKWHGLKDPDLRYRQRYVDLIVNPDVKRNFIIRSNTIKAIREFLDSRDYIEVETPILHTIAGGANARPFITHHNTLDIDMYLRIATELHLKRLIVGGLEKVYEIGRIFRNEGMSIKHNPEFTSIELYEAYADYKDMMELTEDLLSYTAQKVLGTNRIVYQGTEIDLTPPWTRMTMLEAIGKHTGIDFASLKTQQETYEAARGLDIDVEKTMSKGEIVNAVFEERVEEHLIQPTFIMDYPVEVSPLAKRIPDNPDYTRRFEGFIYAREIANAFSELNDPLDQKKRFEEQLKQREAGDEEAHMMDEDYVNALEVGLPPTGGLGIGIDRLVMFFTDAYSIRDVILFPTMKPRD